MIVKTGRQLDALYVQQVNERKKIENPERQIIDDLMTSNQALRDLSHKFKICNKNDDLLKTIED